MTNQEYTKGSEWRKWDLHIHTPASFFWSGGKKLKDMNNQEAILAMEEFITKINDSDVSVFCIMDYRSFDWCIKLMNYKKNQPEELKKTIFYGMELRVESPTDYRLNIHVILSDLLTEQQLIDFKSELEIRIGNKNKKLSNEALIELAKSMDKSKAKKHGYGDPNTLDDDTLLELGSKVAEITKDSLKNAINILPKESGYILLPYDTSDGLLDLNWEEHPQDDNFFMQTADIFETRDQRNIDLFHGKKTNENEKYFDNFFKTLGSKAKPCISGSDAHKFNDYGKNPSNRYTWIKSDPTFEGLKQIIYEPEERICIGEYPETIERIQNNKTKYIKSLELGQTDGYDEKKGIWFKNQYIELNKELVAIIGNKGNGKSALADILGFLGNTYNGGEKNSNFSFLNKERFLKGNLANNFEGKLVWEDGEEIKKNLGTGEINLSHIERVRYLPQNYFNNLTNEIENKQFTDTLESVIFNHLDESLKLGKNSFKELREYKSKLLNDQIEDIKINIRKHNTEIVKLEQKKEKKEVDKIKDKIALKQRELDEQKNLLKELNINKPKDPNSDKKTKAQNSKKFEEIEDLNGQVIKIDKEIEDIKKQKSGLEISKQELTILLSYLRNTEEQISRYITDNKTKYSNIGIDINKVFKLTIKEDIIIKKLEEIEEEIINIQGKFITTSQLIGYESEVDKENIKKNSITIKKESILEKIEKIKKDLSKTEGEYQVYLESKNNIEKKITEITGENTKPDTLNFYENQLNYLTKKDKDGKTAIEKALEELENQRLNSSIEIFIKKQEIIDLYKQFKKPIDDKVEENKDFLDEESQINIDVKFLFQKDFIKSFLYFINQGKRGSFSGKAEGEEILLSIFNSKNIDEDNIKIILKDFINYLRFDKRNGENNEERIVFDQINDLEGFYNYIFSLDYIDINYELKAGNKTLQELSPGEKGTILLIFYLMIDKEGIPLIIDQPEDNLDNQSVFKMLSNFIKKAKKKRQIIIVTHNPNLAVGADAEQIIYTQIDKVNNHQFFFESGSIENPIMNKHIVNILEGTMPAFDKRKLKYQ